MQKGKYSGSYGIIMLPFTKSGDINYQELVKMSHEICDTDAAGIVLCGSSSEFLFMSIEENMEIMSVVSRAVNGRKQLIGGATAAGRDGTVKYLRHMESLGFDGALIAPPYYYIYSPKEISEFYKDIQKDCGNIPIIAYNIPAFTNPIHMDTFNDLLECENIVGLKNSSQNIKEIMHQIGIKKQQRPDFSILTGTDDAQLPCLLAGCDGNFTAFGSIMPEVMARSYRHFIDNEIAEAMEIQYGILPLLRLCDSYSFPVGYKLLAEELGMKNEHYRQSIPPQIRETFENTKMRMRAEYNKLMETIGM